MSEAWGPVEDLVAHGSAEESSFAQNTISKYSHEPSSGHKEPVPEMLKNYMDVSVGRGGG